MASGRGASSRWFFSREQLENTPSRRCGVEADKELSYRQQAANFIQDMGQRLNVSQLTINTAIVYMHRFYMHHSFTKFNRNGEGGGLKLNLSFLGSSLARLITTTQEIHNGMRALHTIGLVWIH